MAKSCTSPLYQIKAWNENFENNRSREIKNASWVAMPNRHDTLGFRTLIGRPNGVMLYGVWCILVQVASKCAPRGLLIRDNGCPHTAASISVKTGLPRESVEECIAVLQEPEIDWLGVAELSVLQKPRAAPPQEGAVIPQEGAVIPQEGAVIPQEGAALPQVARAYARSVRSFVLPGGAGGEWLNLIGETGQAMYAAHPKKRNLPLIPTALAEAVNGIPDVRKFLMQVQMCHAEWCKTKDWKKENGRFAPKLDEWIADKGYTSWPAGSNDPFKQTRGYNKPKPAKE